ncbi:PEPxxWA-CTERM sorting domain-containing protein [Gimibacter soli]|uniref:PEPxxWA-CTERM sorting domain-containing protein n=1 Tax=Gimibacter soli TaxID=3024400 RepID=A0AAE9XSG1_9PROT|nr:PEPxxWA-CTERM sorting domain-containing protein [Gimibacter soli]WCL55537.1 PEPxxWA-CTERM sorting domain-containing protein [Gimibacter soli]
MNFNLKAALTGAVFATAGLTSAEAATTYYSGDGNGTCNGGACVSITPHGVWGDVSDNAGLAANTADWISFANTGIGGSVLPSLGGPRDDSNYTMLFSNTFSVGGTGDLNLWVLADDTALVRITGLNGAVLDFPAFAGQINPCAGGGLGNPVGCVEGDMGSWSFSGLEAGNYTLDIYSFQTGGDVFGMQYAMNVTSAIPEPATWLMMIMGFGLVGMASRRRTGVSMA